MFAQELAVFLLKGAVAIVFLLVLDVSEEGLERAGSASPKRTVAALPVEAAIFAAEALDPFRGFFLQPFEYVCLERVRGSVVTTWT